MRRDTIPLRALQPFFQKRKPAGINWFAFRPGCPGPLAYPLAGSSFAHFLCHWHMRRPRDAWIDLWLSPEAFGHPPLTRSIRPVTYDLPTIAARWYALTSQLIAQACECLVFEQSTVRGRLRYALWPELALR